MLKKVISYIEKNKILQDGDSVLLGVSGGADSVCMLHVLYSLREKYHLKLYVVHVNHGIRGSEAKRDADFVEQMAENLQIPFRVVTANIPEMAKEQKDHCLKMPAHSPEIRREIAAQPRRTCG